MDSLTDEELKKFSTDLQIEQADSKYTSVSYYSRPPKYTYLYDRDDDGNVYVPFAYNQNIPRPDRKFFPETKLSFQGSLLPEQNEVKKEAIAYLNTTGSVILACYPSFGKTCLSLYIACKISLPTIVLCHRIVLINQWRDSIKKFCPGANICILDPKKHKENIPSADFYIVNAMNLPKFHRQGLEHIGLAIFDEIHILMAEKISTCAKYIVPRYSIGLSATPYRNDGLDVLIDMYFGTNKIIRKLYRKHDVYVVETGFKPETTLNSMGKLDWSSVLDSTCNNKSRNELILKIIKFFPDKVFLVICKRVSQAEYILKRLQEEKEDVTSLIGKNQTYSQSSRILVGSNQKVNVGFDHPGLNAMILASDVEDYYVQCLGRVFRRRDATPVIFDILDNHPVLAKHYRTREAVYKEHGGTCRNFRDAHPEFFSLMKKISKDK